MKRSTFHQVVGALVCSGRVDLAKITVQEVVGSGLKPLFPEVPKGKSDEFMINWIKQKRKRFQRPFINSFLFNAGYDKKKIKYLMDKASAQITVQEVVGAGSIPTFKEIINKVGDVLKSSGAKILKSSIKIKKSIPEDDMAVFEIQPNESSNGRKVEDFYVYVTNEYAPKVYIYVTKSDMFGGGGLTKKHKFVSSLKDIPSILKQQLQMRLNKSNTYNIYKD